MEFEDPEIVQEFVVESTEHLAEIENQLLTIEAAGEDIDVDLVNKVFRGIHSIKGAAGFLALTSINELAHSLENVLNLMRERSLIPTSVRVDVMLQSADQLCKLLENIADSNETDVSELSGILDAIAEGNDPVATADTVVEESPSDVPAADDSMAEVDALIAAMEAAGTTCIQGMAPESAPGQEGSQTDSPEVKKPEAKKIEAKKPTDEKPVAAKAAAKKTAPPQPATKKSAPAKPQASPSDAPEATIRVGVRVLDQLMNFAGELVLSRNQLLRVLSEQSNDSNLTAILGGLDQVTTDLQETIMQTRMQPIGSVFTKFPRVIRDLSASLSKKIALEVVGAEVETDKTIIEAIADPLTHLIRNSCDHGIEVPAARLSAGKSEEGQVILRAFHEAGKVIIEIVDDGAGMDPDKLREKAIEKEVITPEAAEKMSDHDAINLIFAPGFSMAKEVTDVSGRGVGMDVVRTNIEKIGGSVEVSSQLGYGSTIRIMLPLTLAIVPSMIVSVNNQSYALPQANIIELVQTGGPEKRIERVSNAEVLRLRGTLIPLVRLRETLNLGADPNANRESQLVVVEAGRSRFALAVDQVLDSEEIVVKPLGRHLANLSLYAGSTILGDGKVAMILDAAGICSQADLASETESSKETEEDITLAQTLKDIQRMVLLSLSDTDHFSVSMDIVSRIERIPANTVDIVGNRKVLQYRGGTLPLLSIDEVVPVTSVDEPEFVYVVVFKVYGHEVGLVAPELRDIRDCDISMGGDACGQPGVAGITVIDNRTTRILDLYGITEIARPEWYESVRSNNGEPLKKRSLKILVCEDSPFFRNFLTKVLVEEGHKISAYEHGEEGWSVLSEHPTEFDLLLTDVEMPELDGIGLTLRVRADGRFDKLPIIALTSLADEESVQRGMDAGVNDYQVKMNKPDLLESILKHTSGVTAS